MKFEGGFFLTVFLLYTSVVTYGVEQASNGKEGLPDMKQDTILNAKSQALASKLKAPEGKRYTSVIPNTLDLTTHAAFGLNGLAGVLDPEANYEFWWWVRYAPVPSEPMLEHHGLSFAACGMKILESFPMMIMMTGSNEYDESFNGLKNLLVSWIDNDGLLYCRVGPKRPWDTVGAEDYANIYGQSRMMLAMMALYQLDKNEAWLELISKMSDALCRIAIDQGTYAYYPVSISNGKKTMEEGYCYTRSGWYDTREAESEKEGQEGSMFVYNQGPIRALSRWYAISGDEKALGMARKLVKYVTRAKYWGTPFDWPQNRDSKIIGSDRAHFTGHFHGHAAMLFALVEYANAANDTRMKEFVRSGYEYLRNLGIARIGLIGESCTISDMIALAIKLTEGGVGDYWDDVDGYIRNQMVEQQLTDPDELLKVYQLSCAEGTTISNPDAEAIIKKTLGIFVDDADLGQIPETQSIQCCTGNGTQGLYYAWESIVRQSGKDGIEVNLLLNRASPWMDIDSYLPFEGKVVLRNKTAGCLLLRIPGWVDRKMVKCSVNGKEQELLWIANYIRLDGIGPKDEIVFTFPVNEETAEYTVITRQQWTSDPRDDKNPPDSSITFKCLFRGNTLVDFSPRPDGRWYLNYRRDHYKQDKAPMKEVTRYVASDIIDW